MSATPNGTKALSEIVVGDRICFQAHQLHNWADKYSKPYTSLSAEVLGCIDLVGGYRELMTTSGRLRTYPGTVEFELVGPDYDRSTQMEYDIHVKPAETFAGRSIE